MKLSTLARYAVGFLSVSAFAMVAFASPQLQRSFSRIAARGGQPEILGSNQLISIMNQYERLDMQAAAYSNPSLQAAQKTEYATMAALQAGGASPYMRYSNCYNPTELYTLFNQRIRGQYVISNQRAFDPYRQVGFCFGRALVAHTQSIFQKSTVPVVKIWALGDLKRGPVHWKFHVATAVLGCDRNWYAMDTLFSTPLPVNRWIQKMRTDYSAAANTLFMVTRPSRFSPDANSYYQNAAFGAPAYNNYFFDYAGRNRL